jgi:peptidyl-prolyl cis-trans isomerase A (cyclophilin A)
MIRLALVLTVLSFVTASLAEEAAKPAAPTHTRVVITTSMGTVVAELFDDQAPTTVANFIALAEGEKPFTDPTTNMEVKRPFYDGLVFHRVIKGFMIQGGCPLGQGNSGPGYKFKDEINAKSLGLDKEMAMVGDDLHPQCQYMQRDFMRLVLRPKMEELGITQDSPMEQKEKAFTQVLQVARAMSLQDFYEKVGYVYDSSLPPSSKPLRGVLAMANSGPGTNGSQFFINLGDTPHLTGKHTVFGKVVAGMEVVDAIGNVATQPGDRPTVPVFIQSIRREKAPAK